ncbi:MerR family transcriptional regulator [Clostridium saudiense]|nr:MerR family transcriptional regulator [Clostridium saudiense]
MEYSIKSLAKLAGISTRTLRYYDEINLLKPLRINSSGYRIYGDKEVDILQQILFYKELELPLEKIKEIIASEDFDIKKALYMHKENILKKQEELRKLLINVEKTIFSLEGGITMSAEEKFEGFKKKMIEENEGKYGKEIREKYGDSKVEESYKKIGNLSKEQWDEVQGLGIQINEKLKEAMSEGNPKAEKAKEVVEMHKRWLSFFGNYPVQAHLGLGQMYVDDERFTAHYDNAAGEGAAVFLRDSIAAYYNAKFNEETWQWIIE